MDDYRAHWLLHHHAQAQPVVVYEAEHAEEYRALPFWTVEGPFVDPATYRGAVDAMVAAAAAIRDADFGKAHEVLYGELRAMGVDPYAERGR